LSYMEQFLRIIDTSPGHLGNMKQSVYSAEIDKCTEICNILYNTFYCITCMQVCKNLFLFFCFLSNKKLSSVTDDTVSSRIELADYKFNLLSLIFAQVFLICI